MSTLTDAVQRKLQPGVVRADDGHVSVEVEVHDVDRLGVSVKGLRVRGRAGDLRARVERLPDALDALPERVAPFEVDPRLGGAILRSPARRREFFEVRTDGTVVSVEKLRSTPEGRERLPFTLTREQLGRLVDGVEAVVGGEEEEG